MKIVILTALLLTTAFGVLAQVSKLTMPPDLIVVQQKWSLKEISNAGSSTPDNPFRANDEQREFARATAQNMRDNDLRAKQGFPPLAPPTRTISSGSSGGFLNTNRNLIYTYQIKVKNTAPKIIRSVTWSYVFIDNSTNSEAGRRAFVSNKSIASGKTEVLKEKSSFYPTGTINATKSGKKFSDSYSEQISIRKIEYEDGSVWIAP